MKTTITDAQLCSLRQLTTDIVEPTSLYTLEWQHYRDRLESARCMAWRYLPNLLDRVELLATDLDGTNAALAEAEEEVNVLREKLRVAELAAANVEHLTRELSTSNAALDMVKEERDAAGRGMRRLEVELDKARVDLLAAMRKSDSPAT